MTPRQAGVKEWEKLRTLSRGSFRNLFFIQWLRLAWFFTRQTCKPLDFLFRSSETKRHSAFVPPLLWFRNRRSARIVQT